MAPPHIDEVLKDIIAVENSPVIVECKLNSGKVTPIVVWYKDGQLQEPSKRVNIKIGKDNCKLEISSVVMKDFGLYHVVGTIGLKKIQTRASIYVRLPPNIYINDGAYYLVNQPFEVMAPVRYLPDRLVATGQSVKLDFELHTANATEFLWYKSNEPIIANERISLMCDRKSAKLLILEAITTDTGIYHLVARTKQGIISSFANVIVTNKMIFMEHTPIIEVQLLDELDCTEFDDVTIMCKVRVDEQTAIEWTKNGVRLIDERFKREVYGNGYIGLKIKQIEKEDAGEYTLVVRNTVFSIRASTNCHILVSDSRDVQVPMAELTKPLEAVVACFGSHATLKCSFDFKKKQYYYAVWYVGHYKVERANHLFNVENYDGDFYLGIKSLKADMAGKICCELRRAYPSGKSVFVVSTTANLAVVPPAFFYREMTLRPLRRRFYYLTPLDEIKKSIKDAEVLNKKMKKLRINIGNTVSTMNYRLRTRSPTDPLELVFCRTDDDRHSFMEVTKRSVDINADSLVVYNKNEGIYVSTSDEELNQKAVIKWDPLKFVSWFAIHLLQPNGVDYYAGVTSKPEFEVRNPPMERMLKFRIKAIPGAMGEASVTILAPTDTVPRSLQFCELKTMQDYAVKYAKTGEKVGSGAFGIVGLVRNVMGDYYAAKTIKIKTDKRRTNTMREYEMMRILKHPNVIELVDVFISRDSFVFIMEYLWGGELLARISGKEHIEEVDVTYYIRQICEGLRYLHSLKIAHLDIKPQNIICLNPNSRQVKLIDLGLSRVLDDRERTKGIYGTKDYVAPEVLNYEKLTVACDMWSLGVVTYMLLSGVMPFAGDTWPQCSANITRARYNFEDSAFKEVSNQAKNFINNLLVLNPYKRLDSTLALVHPWITQGPSNSACPHMKRTKQNLKSHLSSYRNRWQRANNLMIPAHRLRNQIGQRNTADPESTTKPVTKTLL